MPVFLRAPARRARRALLLATSLTLAACGGGGNDGGGSTGPTATPAILNIISGQSQTGRVGTSLTQPLVVQVLDDNNRPIRNVNVDFRANAGSGSTSPSRATTGSDGRATATWTLGTTAGPQSVSASVLGVTAMTFQASASPGAATQVVISPSTASVPVGDTLRLTGAVRDEFGNVVPGNSLTWTSDAPAVVTVSAQGTLRAVATGTATVRAASSTGSLTGTVGVTVVPVGASVCGAVAPTALRVGQVAFVPSTAQGATVCIAADAAGSEYGLVTVSGSTVYANTTPFTVAGQGLGGLNAIEMASDLGAVLGHGAPMPAFTMPAPTDGAWRRDEAFERALRARERRELGPLRAERLPFSRDEPSRGLQSFNTPRTATVGQLLTLNANANSACQSPDNRIGRVAAISDRLIIVADTANPPGGYTDEEYRGIAAFWDSVIHPMDVQNFGEPSNIGGYNRVIAFYTRAVNQLSPRGANFVIGGFFFQRDLFPKSNQPGFTGCAGSNEAEMMYLLVPDPTGVVNGNIRSKENVTRFNYGTLAHEFQHLINSSRRLHLTPGGDNSEEVWLDEGLSHTAEELLFYRVAGLTERQNLDIQRILSTTTTRDAFNNYGLSNLVRLGEYLPNPSTNSPWAPNDQLSTRGAIWQFLRFVAARTSDPAAFYRRLADAPQSGIANLQANLPGPLPDLLRDWSVAQLADDVAPGLPVEYSFPSWNFRSVLGGLRQNNGQPLFPSYPLPVRVLTSGAALDFSLQGGGAAFHRFGVPASRTGLVTVQTNGGAMPSTARVAVVRLR